MGSRSTRGMAGVTGEQGGENDRGQHGGEDPGTTRGKG